MEVYLSAGVPGGAAVGAPPQRQPLIVPDRLSLRSPTLKGTSSQSASRVPAVLAAVAIAARHRRSTSRSRGKALHALSDDVVTVVEEALNTVEDAAMHVFRLPSPPATEESEELPDLSKPSGRRRVVVLGSGWAAHAMSKVIDTSSDEIIILSPRNYFIFTPMLAAAAVGTVEYRSILEHIRVANPTLRFFESTCEGVDLEKRQVMVRPRGKEDKPFPMPYDVLVVSVGVKPSSLGVPGVYEHCLFMKGIDDARQVRSRVTECFERADLPIVSEQERRRLLTFAVVGGGPTGCEFCGELSDFLRNDLRQFYPQLAPLVRILLVHRGKTILPDFGADLQDVALETLTAQGIEVRTSTGVVSVSAGSINIQLKGATEEQTIPCGLCVWAGGNGGQDIVKDLIQKIPAQAELAKEEGRGNTSRLFVDDWLRVVGAPNGSLLAMGDCARTAGASPLPQTAQVAAQQGAYLARLLNRGYLLDSDTTPHLPENADLSLLLRSRWQKEAPKFNFVNLGQLAFLGGEKAVAEVGLGSMGTSKAQGQAAFLLWRSVYLVKQVSFRNRILVLFDWIKSRVFGRDLTRF